jgi:hypothetical protein
MEETIMGEKFDDIVLLTVVSPDKEEPARLAISKSGYLIARRLEGDYYACTVHPDYLMKSNVRAFRPVFEIEEGEKFAPKIPAIIKRISDKEFVVVKKGLFEYR